MPGIHCVVHVLVILCLPDVYTEYTGECINIPEGVARGFINTFPSEFCIRTMKDIEYMIHVGDLYHSNQLTSLAQQSNHVHYLVLWLVVHV